MRQTDISKQAIRDYAAIRIRHYRSILKTISEEDRINEHGLDQIEGTRNGIKAFREWGRGKQ